MRLILTLLRYKIIAFSKSHEYVIYKGIAQIYLFYIRDI